jgi:hypothetical protein
MSSESARRAVATSRAASTGFAIVLALVVVARSRAMTADSVAADVVTCDAVRTLAMLSAAPQPSLGWFSRTFASVFTPFKRLGISGWKQTGCTAVAVGRTVRDAQHSTDGFWTIDVALDAFAIGGQPAPGGTFIRIEVEPQTKAHAVCDGSAIRAGAVVRFGGRVLIDTDGQGFLEVHPDQDFSLG